MRNRSDWHEKIVDELAKPWPQELARDFPPGHLCDVELGLHLLAELAPGQPAAAAWTLLGGYPYPEALGYVRTHEQRVRRERARYYLWPLRRRQVWLGRLFAYLQVPQELRGFELDAVNQAPTPREPSFAPTRFDLYNERLAASPAFERRRLPIAGSGEYTFRQGERYHSVVFDAALLPTIELAGHDLGRSRPGLGPLTEVPLQELVATAAWMEQFERDHDLPCRYWVDRLARVELLAPNQDRTGFVPAGALPLEDLMHMVGMVGAGKSTLRDILTVWAVKRGYRVTVVVGNVAETLGLVDLFTQFGLSAAPVLGHSTRERNTIRLHRRLATAGAASMLAHQGPSFDYLSTACPVDALRGSEASVPLRVREAPCIQLLPADHDSNDQDAAADGEPPASTSQRTRPKPHGCPLWGACPRHHGARALVDADIWVATPAGLVHSAVPDHLNPEQLRYLELAARRSDLIIVDEADRVQMQLDTVFCPAATLSGRGSQSWLDEVQGHKIDELARRGRLQLSDRTVDDWATAVNTVTTANDRLYRLLVQKPEIRAWVGTEYFSSFTLHGRLLDAWYPLEPDTAADSGAPDQGTATSEQAAAEALRARRMQVGQILNDFRDDPLGHSTIDDPMVDRLVRLTLELLHAPQSATTRQRLREMLAELASVPVPEADAPSPPADSGPGPAASPDDQFEFTLLLAVLHTSLDFMTTLWSRVEAALNLESTSNVLSRRPPKDYEPVIPESPMGNILGFQFRQDEQVGSDGERSGELLFFRCGGVGRELLPALATMSRVDNRPGPKVLLMSATSWAGTSSRYHLRIPVGAILRPHPAEVQAILDTVILTDIQYGAQGPLRLSGEDQARRPVVLCQMLDALAKPDTYPGAVSKFAQELAQITDPDRRRLLVLTGSYDEAKTAAEHLAKIEEWKGRVVRLVPDDADLDDSWAAQTSQETVKALRLGDIDSFPRGQGQILVAPLLAVERGHNIVLTGGTAAIGTVYFLARPHPRPDDINLAIHAINDWAMRQVHDGSFAQLVRAIGSLDAAGQRFRGQARDQWQRLMTRKIAWSSLSSEEKESFAWDQLVVMWQVIGRLVRGGVPARVVLVDAAFFPKEAGLTGIDTPDTSLVYAMQAVLDPYFSDSASLPALDRALVKALYEPLHRALITRT